MCIHTDVMEDSDRDAVDSLCRFILVIVSLFRNRHTDFIVTFAEI